MWIYKLLIEKTVDQQKLTIENNGSENLSLEEFVINWLVEQFLMTKLMTETIFINHSFN